MAEIRSLPIIEEAQGSTLISTWLILIREDFEYFFHRLNTQVVGKRVVGGRRAFELNLAIHHEFVHFLQAFTTAFTYNYSRELLSLFAAIMATSRDGMLNGDTLPIYRKLYSDHTTRLQNRFRGISVIDLLEAMAVTESFRCVAPQVNTIAFGQYLERCFPELDSPYRRALTAMTQNFDEDVALHVTPRFCFLALNGDHPPKNFWHFIDRLRGEDPARLCDL
jgi:hypothetical protein